MFILGHQRPCGIQSISRIHYEFLKKLNAFLGFISKDKVFLGTFLSLCLTFNILGDQRFSGRERVIARNELLRVIERKRYYSTNSTFELQIDFKNECNCIYAFFIDRYFRLYRRDGIYAIMASHSLLLELGYMSWDFSGHGWFMRFSLPWPTSRERSLTITGPTNHSFCQNNFEIQ